MVNAIDWVDSIWFPCISEWCAQVTVTPDASKIAVFNKGIWNGFNGFT